ncbi:hypothetical protein pqer_cds_478 [Pandoravirus quercus]|uniref:Uncharacterized protein n=1 Tax=Pandoravirus quercus TaxID=2107709 RepID=A0A2U7U941_9VIRU|nr:hypothetical protein pqer_cds_478 [Pandoravirus quercus]AVK74900.1 hypothetical protein pqer_cds_478 [Pandoravirus quercus]
MAAPPFETFAPHLPRRAAALRAAMTYQRTVDAGVPDAQTERCDYWCNPADGAQFDECRGVVRASAKLRASGLTEATAEIIDDVSWYYKQYGACQVDGFDVRSNRGIALRATRLPPARTSTYRGVVDVAATGRGQTYI